MLDMIKSLAISTAGGILAIGIVVWLAVSC